MITLAVALVLAASSASAPPAEAPRAGAQVASAPVRAAIVEAVVVRQASGPQQHRNAPVPQLSRNGRTILVEFE